MHDASLVRIPLHWTLLWRQLLYIYTLFRCEEVINIIVAYHSGHIRYVAIKLQSNPRPLGLNSGSDWEPFYGNRESFRWFSRTAWLGTEITGKSGDASVDTQFRILTKCHLGRASARLIWMWNCRMFAFHSIRDTNIPSIGRLLPTIQKLTEQVQKHCQRHWNETGEESNSTIPSRGVQYLYAGRRHRSHSWVHSWAGIDETK